MTDDSNHLHLFNPIIRPYNMQDIWRLQGKTKVEHTLAKRGAGRLRGMLQRVSYTAALGAMTGNQAVQMVKAGLTSVYCSGWQVAADANTDGHTYPDQSLYSADGVPTLVKRINNALLRAEQIDCLEGKDDTQWMVPIVADAEAGFGGPLNAFELMKAMIEAGAAGVHFEDQLSSAKKCGHLAGKVLVPPNQFIQTLIAARLASDVLDVPTVIIARTDADSANLLTSDIDPLDEQFIDRSKRRTTEGFYHLKGEPMDRCVARALAYAPYADALWMETSHPDIAQAQEFARRVHERFPGKSLFYNCSPSFAWSKNLDKETIAVFQRSLASFGYTYQFITLAGWHLISHGAFDMSHDYKNRGMAAYVELQDKEFQTMSIGYTAVKHQREAATSYFDAVAQAISGGTSSTLALQGSTESVQFTEHGHDDGVPLKHG